MDNFESPWLTFTNAADDPNYLGDALEMAALNRRVEALDEALRTGSSFDVLLDMLAEDGQDPLDYVARVGRNLDLVYACHLVPDDWDVWQKEF